jgi:hypothetical protein
LCDLLELQNLGLDGWRQLVEAAARFLVKTPEVERVHEDVLPIAGLVEVINIRRRSDRRPAFNVDFAFLGPVPALFFNVSLFLVVLGFGPARWSAPSALTLFLILGGELKLGRRRLGGSK